MLGHACASSHDDSACAGDQRALAEQRAEVHRMQKTRRLLVAMIALVGVFAVAEFAFGIATGSLAILADAFHMISDMLGLVVGLVAVRLASRPRSLTQTYGFKRAETIGALVNGVFLLAVVMFIIVDSIERFIEPPVLAEPLLIVGVGVGGLFVNLIGLALFSANATLRKAGGHSHSHSHPDAAAAAAASDNESERAPHRSANLHAVFLHVLGDALGSVGVILTGLVVHFAEGEWKYYADPVFSVLLGLLIAKTSVPVVCQSAYLLLQSVPRSVDLQQLSLQLLGVQGVDHVGSVHVWALSETDLVGSAHLDCLASRPFDAIAHDVKAVFRTSGVDNVTIEPHFVDCSLDVGLETKLHLAHAHATEFQCE
jgi:solute carrier family 30 (zinc transporter), member 1